jgi:hypothetical protein
MYTSLKSYNHKIKILQCNATTCPSLYAGLMVTLKHAV